MQGASANKVWLYNGCFGLKKKKKVLKELPDFARIIEMSSNYAKKKGKTWEREWGGREGRKKIVEERNNLHHRWIMYVLRREF